MTSKKVLLVLIVAVSAVVSAKRLAGVPHAQWLCPSLESFSVPPRAWPLLAINRCYLYSAGLAKLRISCIAARSGCNAR